MKHHKEKMSRHLKIIIKGTKRKRTIFNHFKNAKVSEEYWIRKLVEVEFERFMEEQRKTIEDLMNRKSTLKSIETFTIP
jgi:hypothetical protein